MAFDEKFRMKKIIAEAISAVLREAGVKFDDDYRNWIIACSFIEELKEER